jgi:DnaK suppressor protein
MSERDADPAVDPDVGGDTDPDVGHRLRRLRDETAGRRTTLRRDLSRIIEAAQSVSTDDEHDPEGATIAFERAQLAALLDQAERQLAELDAAVARLDAEDYGRCEVCGEPIAAERLLARPAATRCIRCAGTPRR